MEIDVEAAEAVTALQVTEVDRLKAANLQLKILLLQERRNNTIRAFQAQCQELDGQLRDLQAEVQASQATLSEKYGIDFSTQQIDGVTGKIVAAPKKE